MKSSKWIWLGDKSLELGKMDHNLKDPIIELRTKCQDMFRSMKEQAIFELIEMAHVIPLLCFSDTKTIDGAKKIVKMLREQGFDIFERGEVGPHTDIFKTTFVLQYNDNEIAYRDVHLDLRREKRKEPDSFYSLYGAEPGEDI